MKATCAWKTDERRVNGDIKGGESQWRTVEDEKSLVNKGRIGDEYVKQGGIWIKLKN